MPVYINTFLRIYIYGKSENVLLMLENIIHNKNKNKLK